MASFYSEIGSLEETQNPSSSDNVSSVSSTVPNLKSLHAALSSVPGKRLFPINDDAASAAVASVEVVKKKPKKKKVSGLNNKLNDISGMVAKWQQVQNEYNG